MTAPTSVLMKAEDFFAWCNRPENRAGHYELVRGKVVEMARPGERHGYICGNIARILGNYTFQVRSGYVCSNDTGVIFGRDPDTVQGPDLLYYKDARFFADLNPKYTEQPPTLVIEVLSPTDRMSKVTRRITSFLNAGVVLAWLFDPEDRNVTIYRPDKAPQVLDTDQDLTDDGVLPSFRCRVADFFFMPGEDPAAQPSASLP